MLDLPTYYKTHTELGPDFHHSCYTGIWPSNPVWCSCLFWLIALLANNSNIWVSG